MKMIIGFVIGVILSAVFLGMTGYSQAQSGESELSDLLPDIGKIYREALYSPFEQVESEIQDEDIYNYYHHLVQNCGLNRPVDE